eukprot:3055250-Amphidinium_carterae.1
MAGRCDRICDGPITVTSTSNGWMMNQGPWSSRISRGRADALRCKDDLTVVVSAKLADGAQPVTNHGNELKADEEKLLPWEEGFLALEY